MNGVTINGLHSWDDLALILTSAEIGQPEPITHFIEVPGRPMPIDTTDAVYGGVKYKSRQISLAFAVEHSFQQFHQAYSRIANLWHGKKVKISFDTDPNSYYMGRATVSAEKTTKGVDQISVMITAEPFKYYIQKPTGDYLWDEINFEQDILQNFQNLAIPANTATEVSVTAGDRPLTPTITTTQAMQVTVKGKIYSTTKDEPLELPIVLYRETASFSVTSTVAGTISITFRGESL